MRLLHVTLLLLLAALATGAPARAAQLTVDDDRTECPSAQHVTVAAAVGAAAAGDTVSICPGTYTEGVGGPGTNALLIEKNLTIRGAGADLVTLRPNGDIGEAVPVARNGAGNVITVNGADVDLSGLTVRGNGAAGDFAEAGIVFLDAASSSLINARIGDIVTSAAPGALGENTGFGLIFASAASSGQVPFTVAGTLIEGYNKAGALIDGPRVVASASAVRVRGHGPQNQQNQVGLEVTSGAAARVGASTITGNRRTDAPRDSAGVRMVGANVPASAIHESNLQGNGFGALNLAANGSDAANPLDATGNFWGDPDGPSPDGSTEPPPAGDRVNASVTFSPFETTPAAAPRAPASQPDAQPGVTITSPADGTTLAPGAATTITAAASDDIGTRSVTFRRGSEVLSTDSLAPYEAAYTPSAVEDGTAQSLTATATDSRGQTTTAAVSVRVAGPAGSGTVDDASPSVEILEPAVGTVVPKPRAVTLAAAAFDDGAIDNVTFVVNDREICRVTTAPFSCSYFPTGADVGRVTVVAIATDSTGQTATAVRSINVGRFSPRGVTTAVSAERAGPPYRLVTRGKLALPPTVTVPQGCGIGGAISVQLQVPGRRALATEFVRLRSNCTYVSRTILAAGRVPRGTRKLTVRTRFLGNAILQRRRGVNGTVTLRRSRRSEPPPVAVDPNR